jgi:hypothetical protein
MGYAHKRYGRGRRAARAMGDIVSTIEGALSTGLSAVDDPYLPEVICRVQQLQSINNGQTPGNCTDTALGLPGGVGLGKVIVPLRAFVFAEENPWVYFVAAGLVIGLPMYIGYRLGGG